jgi:hypothetical protein
MRDDPIILDWRDVNHESGRWADRWDYTLALYAILHPAADEILYLGKADGDTSTVRRRWDADDKHDRVWRRIEDERGLFEHGFIVGEFRPPLGMRLTRELVCDIESLLIYQIQPWANQQNTKSRGFTRRGMAVLCQGHWPLRRGIYRDE